MKCLSRNTATLLLICAIIGILAGCVQSKPSATRNSLEEIESTVPRITGLPLEQAERILQFVALKIGDVVLKETDDPSLHAQVFEQNPAPGTKAGGGTAVDVAVYRYVAPEEGTSSP